MSATQHSANQVAAPLLHWEENLPILDRAPGGDDDGDHAGLGPGAGNDPRGPGARSRAIEEDARHRAEETVRAAGVRAEQILQEARGAAATLRADAIRAATDAVAEEQQAAFTEVVGLLRQSVEYELSERWRQLELESARLCVDFAEKVIRRAIAEDDEIVVDTVREGLTQLRATSPVSIHVHPSCIPALEQARAKLAAELAPDVPIIFEPREAVSAGGASLTSANGAVDLQIEAQVARLRQAAETAITKLTREEPAQ